MISVRRILAVSAFALGIAACGNAGTREPAFDMDYPGWNAKDSNDRLNVVSMVSPDRQCYFDLAVAQSPPDPYRKVVEGYMRDQGARILSEDPLSYEFDTPGGKLTFLAKTRTLPCGSKAYLATVTCVRSQFDDRQAGEIFDSMQCGYAASGESTSTEVPPPSGASGRPMLGIVVSSKGKFNHANVTEAFETAAGAGAQITRHYVSWTDVETKQGKYSWKSNDYMIGRVRAVGMRLSVAFHIIRTAIRGPRPADLESRGWEDPELIARFSDMVLAFLDRYGDTVDFVEIGSEVNAYFERHADEVEPFRAFYAAVHRNIRARYPQVSVGTVFAYRELRESGNFDVYHRLSIGDHDGFTLYVFGDDFAHTKDPRQVGAALNEIADLTGDRRFALEEIGWSASPELSGSESSQRAAVESMFDFIEHAPDRLLFANWFTLHDGQSQDCDRIARSFSRAGDALSRQPQKMDLFSHFLCNFGLRRNDGSPRPAWDAWVERAKAYRGR